MGQDNSRGTDSPAVAQPLTLGELDGARAGTGAVLSASALANPLRNVRVKLTVCVGSAELTVGELLGAKAQQVVRLDTGVDQAVDVLLDGQVVARGTLVAVDDSFGVRITELPAAMELPIQQPTKG